MQIREQGNIWLKCSVKGDVATCQVQQTLQESSNLPQAKRSAVSKTSGNDELEFFRWTDRNSRQRIDSWKITWKAHGKPPALLMQRRTPSKWDATYLTEPPAITLLKFVVIWNRTRANHFLCARQIALGKSADLTVSNN
jgi:hypothetical protein